MYQFQLKQNFYIWKGLFGDIFPTSSIEPLFPLSVEASLWLRKPQKHKHFFGGERSWLVKMGPPRYLYLWWLQFSIYFLHTVILVEMSSKVRTQNLGEIQNVLKSFFYFKNK